VTDNEILKTAELYKLLRDEKAEAEEHIKVLNGQIDKAMTKLSDLMLENDMPGFKHNGVQFSLATTTRASAIAGDKTELYNALRQNGHGDMVTETVNANSLSSFVREQIAENGDKLPDWLIGKVNIYEVTVVKLKKI
jgi:hypothetical protein